MRWGFVPRAATTHGPGCEGAIPHKAGTAEVFHGQPVTGLVVWLSGE